MSLSVKSLLCAGLSLCASGAFATTVQFQTVMGDFEVNLYDEDTPQTVENFLAYVNSGAYSNTFVHRTVSGFVVQGGGFTYDAEGDSVSAIADNAPVTNEPEFANVRGTIAMAKVSGQPNSATNEWFFNLADNTSSLDGQNGGFTVFGEVTGNGMAIVDAIAALNRGNFSGDEFFGDVPLTTMPVRDYLQSDYDEKLLPDEDHIVIVQNIVVLDAAPDTAAGLNPPANTGGSNGGGDSNGGGSSGGGGSLGLGLLLLLGLCAFAGRKT